MGTFSWVVFIVVFIILIIVAQKFKKTSLLSTFPFLDGEEVIFSDDPERLEHVQVRDRNRILMRPAIRVTNKGRIIFAQRTFRSDDARVFAVFTLETPSDSVMKSWSEYGFPIVPLDKSQVYAKTAKKSGLRVIFSGESDTAVNRMVENTSFILEVYTQRISEYEKALGMSIPVRN